MTWCSFNSALKGLLFCALPRHSILLLEEAFRLLPTAQLILSRSFLQTAVGNAAERLARQAALKNAHDHVETLLEQIRVKNEEMDRLEEISVCSGFT
jgi:hypothetical protein